MQTSLFFNLQYRVRKDFMVEQNWTYGCYGEGCPFKLDCGKHIRKENYRNIRESMFNPATKENGLFCVSYFPINGIYMDLNMERYINLY